MVQYTPIIQMNRPYPRKSGKRPDKMSPEDRLRKITCGALSSTISAHGSINGSLIGSASKRIVKQLLAQYPAVVDVIGKHVA